MRHWTAVGAVIARRPDRMPGDAKPGTRPLLLRMAISVNGIDILFTARVLRD
jgi:hypothetical protein